MTSCKNRVVKATRELGNRYVKGAAKDWFFFYSWFYSKKSEEAVMGFGADIIGMVKANKKLSFKDTIENLTKFWPVFSHLVLKINPMVPGYRSLIYIGYTYKKRKFLSLIFT